MSINRVSFTIREFVNREVYVNASHLVDELIKIRSNGSICRQLSKNPFLDYSMLEEFDFDNIDWPTDKETDEPVEVFEWWLVSGFMGRKLLEKKELIIKSGNLTIWGRTTTGQHMQLDSVIEDIYNEIH